MAEEAARTAELMGNDVDRLYDVGVAGLHRLLGERERLAAARVIIVVAGMEGALPSVVAGLVSVPVIAVPTSIGYGASFGGIAALLGMLNSCASGVSVVNIDNGFGAANIASLDQPPLGRQGCRDQVSAKARHGVSAGQLWVRPARVQSLASSGTVALTVPPYATRRPAGPRIRSDRRGRDAASR